MLRTKIKKLSTLLTFLILAPQLTSCIRHQQKEISSPSTPILNTLEQHYSLTDLRKQLRKTQNELLDRYFVAKSTQTTPIGKGPCIIFSAIDNRSDSFFSQDDLSHLIEENALQDGRYKVVVSALNDEQKIKELLENMYKESLDSPESFEDVFLGKIRIHKTTLPLKKRKERAYRLTITLYDPTNHEAIDSAGDTLIKKNKGVLEKHRSLR